MTTLLQKLMAKAGMQAPAPAPSPAPAPAPAAAPAPAPSGLELMNAIFAAAKLAAASTPAPAPAAPVSLFAYDAQKVSDAYMKANPIKPETIQQAMAAAANNDFTAFAALINQSSAMAVQAALAVTADAGNKSFLQYSTQLPGTVASNLGEASIRASVESYPLIASNPALSGLVPQLVMQITAADPSAIRSEVHAALDVMLKGVSPVPAPAPTPAPAPAGLAWSKQEEAGADWGFASTFETAAPAPAQPAGAPAPAA